MEIQNQLAAQLASKEAPASTQGFQELGGVFWKRRYYPSKGEPGYEEWRVAQNVKQRLQHAKHREKRNAYSRAYNKRNRERLLVYQKEWEAKNPNWRKEYGRKQWAKHRGNKNSKRREKYKSDAGHRAKKTHAHKKWYQNNSDKVAASGHNRYWSNVEHFRKKAREYAKNNHEAILIRNKARELRKRGQTVGDVRVMTKWVKRWKALPNVTCYWCLKSFDPKQCEAEHMIPICRNGPHSIENLCIACKPCNDAKAGKPLAKWNSLIYQPILQLGNILC